LDPPGIFQLRIRLIAVLRIGDGVEGEVDGAEVVGEHGQVVVHDEVETGDVFVGEGVYGQPAAVGEAAADAAKEGVSALDLGIRSQFGASAKPVCWSPTPSTSTNNSRQQIRDPGLDLEADR